MALSIDTIRSFADSKSIMLDQRRMDFASAPLQKFRCYFNIGDARQRNADTLVAIHHAILNDPRFAAHDIHVEAARLLGEVNVERAVTAGQITGILQKLDDFANDTKKRVFAHLAATMPAWAAGHEEAIAGAVLAAVNNNRRGAIDLTGLIGDALDRVHVALTHAGDDPALREVVLRTLKSTLFEFNHTLSSHEKIQQRVDAFREDLAHLDACAGRSADPVAAKRLGIEFLANLGKPVHPSLIDAMDEFACDLPFGPLGSLGPDSSASDIICAVHRMAEALRTKRMAYPDGVAPLEGGDEVLPLNVFLVQRAIAELPDQAQMNLLAALESKEGYAACSYIAYEAGDGAAERDYYIVNYASKYLQRRAGKPEGCPGTYEELPDFSKFSPLARCAFDVNHVIVGGELAPIKAIVLDPHGFGREVCPGAALHKKIDAAAKTMTSCTFASEMKKIVTDSDDIAFDKDITRGMDVTLPDGRRLSSDRTLARDELAQFVSGDPEATYAGLSPADRARANVFIALLSQETEKAVQIGIPLALAPTGDTAIFGGVINSGTPVVRSFAISGSPAEGFSIHYNGEFPYMTMIYEDADGGTHNTKPELQIVGRYELEINISAESLEKVVATDWASYDGTESDDIMMAVSAPNRLERSYNAIPEGFRLDADVSAGFTLQVDEG